MIGLTSNKPFETRRSMRPIENRFIMMAQTSGFEDMNEWIDLLIKNYEKKLKQKDAQYQALKQEYEKVSA